MSTFESVYSGHEDDSILGHIDRLNPRLDDLTAGELHVLLASWERLETLTSPRGYA